MRKRKGKLVIVMVITAMLLQVMPALADGRDGGDNVAPYGTVLKCHRCGVGTLTFLYEKNLGTSSQGVLSCSKVNAYHYHMVTGYAKYYSCDSCGNFVDYVDVSVCNGPIY